MKRLASVAIVFMVLWLVVPSIGQAQLYPEWGDSYNGTDNLNDVAVDLVAIGETLYVVGGEKFYNPPYERSKIVIRKYSPDGILLAEGEFPPPELADTVSQAVPNCIVALSGGKLAVGGSVLRIGTSGGECLLVIFNPDLSVHAWHIFSGNFLASHTGLFFLAYEPVNGCIYGAGAIVDTASSLFYDKVIVVKYDTEAQPLWDPFPQFVYSHYSRAYGFAIDEAGNSYVTARDGTYDVISTASFDTNGDLRWSDSYVGPDNTVCYDLAIDLLGRVHVVGYSGSADIDAIDLVYSSTGDFLETETLIYDGYAPGLTAYFVSLAFDQSGNRYLIGGAEPSTGGDLLHALIVKTDLMGQVQWQSLWTHDSTYSHEASLLVLDDYGRLMVCERGHTGFSAVPENNFLVFNQLDGTLVGYAQTLVVDDPVYSYHTLSLTRSESGNIYFCGDKQFSGQGLDWAVIKFIPFVTGEASWDNLLRPNDLTRLVGFLKGKWDIYPSLIGDVNGDCLIDLADVTYYVQYFMSGDFPPAYGDCVDLEAWFLDQVGP